MLGVFFPWRMEQIFNFKETLISHLHLRSRVTHNSRLEMGHEKRIECVIKRTHQTTIKIINEPHKRATNEMETCVVVSTIGLWDIRLCLVTTRPLYLCTDLVVQQWQRFTHTHTTHQTPPTPSLANKFINVVSPCTRWMVGWLTHADFAFTAK